MGKAGCGTGVVISGPPDFYRVTKAFHNGLQGQPVAAPYALTDMADDMVPPMLASLLRTQGDYGLPAPS